MNYSKIINKLNEEINENNKNVEIGEVFSEIRKTFPFLANQHKFFKGQRGHSDQFGVDFLGFEVFDLEENIQINTLDMFEQLLIKRAKNILKSLFKLKI